MRICSFEECGRPLKIKGLCIAHYNMWNRGKPLHPIGKRGCRVNQKTPIERGCDIPECTNEHRAKGYCSNHYNQIVKHGCIKAIRKQGKVNCVAQGCERPSRTKDMCLMHYHRMRSTGTTELITHKKIVLTKIPKPLCKADGCKCISQHKGYCQRHYKLIVLQIIPRARGGQKKPKQPCDVGSCENFARCKGLCDKHYTRMRVHGDTGVNYHRKYRRSNVHLVNIMRPDNKYSPYFSTADEKEILNEMYRENIGIHEQEDIY